DLSQIATKVVAFLAVATERPGTSHLLMSVESLCWVLTDFIAIKTLPELWKKIVQAAQRSRDISLRKWQIISEFVHERLKLFLYPEPENRFSAEAAKFSELGI
ncbi:MAG: hypothetical protein WCG97_03895, partial [bacterium]